MEVPRLWRLAKNLRINVGENGDRKVATSHSVKEYTEWKEKFVSQGGKWSEKKLKELCRGYGIMWE